jgi:hypothetical protein
MPKITADKLKAGMKLTKPVLNKAGMMLLGEGTELTETWIRRIQDMDIAVVHVDGPEPERVPKEELLAEVDKRFKNMENKPYMGQLKRALQRHIECLYA